MPRLWAILVILAAFAPGAFSDTLQPPPIGKLVDVGGYRVHLYCTGTGTPTVIVAGGGFSFDWGLVQPKVAESTQICTYDPSGTAWSDPLPGPTASCPQRVGEIHRLLTNAPVAGPYVLVGFSIGGLYARLYGNTYPNEVAGMVLVDHAFTEGGEGDRPAVSNSATDGRFSVQQVDTPPALISATPISLGIEDDRNFSRLPQLNRSLHAWAMSAQPVRPMAEMAAECNNAVSTATKNRSRASDSFPLIVISTPNDSPQYGELQTMLLSLSRDSRQIVAENSTHMVIVDAPEVIVRAILQVVTAVRNHRGLQK